jgi:cysteine-rich repeat protein
VKMKIETGFICGSEPSVCLPICGDGLRVGSEVCDDGNLQNGDGCGEKCDEMDSEIC